MKVDKLNQLLEGQESRIDKLFGGNDLVTVKAIIQGVTISGTQLVVYMDIKGYGDAWHYVRTSSQKANEYSKLKKNQKVDVTLERKADHFEFLNIKNNQIELPKTTKPKVDIE